MKTKTRILFLCSIGLMFLLGYINYLIYIPPTNLDNYYPVSQGDLIKHSDDYEGYKIIILGYIYNISLTEKFVYFKCDNGILKINCSLIDITGLSIGIETHFKGLSFINSKGYILAEDAYVIINYSLPLSIIGLIIVILIIFFVLKFNPKSFSFEIRKVN